MFKCEIMNNNAIINYTYLEMDWLRVEMRTSRRNNSK